MNKHSNKQQHDGARRRRQELPPVLLRSSWLSGWSYQARSWQKPAEWYFKALGRFANTDDTPKEYEALSKAFRSFWPLSIEDGKGNELGWHSASHQLFLFYRDLVRGFWIREESVLRDGFNVRLLFGTLDYDEIQAVLAGTSFRGMRLDRAIAPLLNTFPRVRISSNTVDLAKFWPDWHTRTVMYSPGNDFQRAIWLLFTQSWRAKVCPGCSTYFLVSKPAQIYCGLSCSSAAHQASSLKWWREKGLQRRTARSKKRLNGDK